MTVKQVRERGRRVNNYPLRHLSVRVPWHDSGWAGTVCAAPKLNSACAKRRCIANAKQDEQEVRFHGRSLEDLPRENRPCCVNKRATFMAPFEMERVKRHALAEVSKEPYGHFRPTPQRYPDYSVGIVPFRWMMGENLPYYADSLDLDADEIREPDLVKSCRMVEVPEVKGSTFLQESLIYRTSRGLTVRSKSGRIITKALATATVSFEYEKPLKLGGMTRFPDFTIEDETSGRTFYRKHLGMLDRPDYCLAWEKKLAWYRAHGVLPAEDGCGSAGMLVTTTESATESFDGESVKAAIAVFSG